MNYELALELKNAGFPQRENVHPDYKDSSIQWEGNRRDGYIYKPTLEELIEACGSPFSGLGQTVSGGWWASAEGDDVTVYGPTPTEAVAALYLALNPITSNNKE